VSFDEFSVIGNETSAMRSLPKSAFKFRSFS